MSLIEVLISLAISSILAVTMAHMLGDAFKSQKHLTYREELTHLRKVISTNLSCSKTLTKQVLNQCTKPYDQTGKLGSSDLVALLGKNGVVLSPNSINGNMSIGRWAFRARCVNTSSIRTVQIAVARFEPNNQSVSSDPMNGKKLDWMPLFSESMPLGQTLCQDEILKNSPGENSIEAPHISQATMEGASQLGCGEGLVKFFTTIQTSRVFRQTVFCEDGKVAVGGGAECNPGAGRKSSNILAAIQRFGIGDSKGLLITSRPIPNGKGWYVECCLKAPGIGILNEFPAPQAYALCFDKSASK